VTIDSVPPAVTYEILHLVRSVSLVFFYSSVYQTAIAYRFSSHGIWRCMYRLIYTELSEEKKGGCLVIFGVHIVLMKSVLPRPVMWLFNDSVLTLLSSPLSLHSARFTQSCQCQPRLTQAVLLTCD